MVFPVSVMAYVFDVSKVAYTLSPHNKNQLQGDKVNPVTILMLTYRSAGMTIFAYG
jgi:hypothetical protein|tara:strand:+ start:683 stop:850 length:168 start_codon:yes stop_codon:yes gene_type:complete